MDAVELSLPANVVVSKLMASDGFGRVGELENRGSAGDDASIFGSQKAPDVSPYRRDRKLSLTISEYSSLSRNKKTDTELCIHDNMLPSFKCEENGTRHHLEEAHRSILLFPKHEGKLLSRKSIKKITFPCSKRPRTDQPENSMRAAGADDHDAMSKKIGYDVIRCTSTDKSRMIKQKCVQDGKRIDKKNCRASVKTKYDSFTSKSGLISSDSVSGGNNILGIYGLRADLHDVTKHVEELSLNELLDGSYNYPNLCLEKGKKALNVNENILLSIKKACSVLPPHGAVDSSDNRKAFMGLLNPSSCSANMSDCEDNGKCMEELFSKVQNPCQANLSDSTLSQPKDILERLTLSPTQDLEALILNLSMNSVPLQSTMHMKKIRSASLPPFPWSFSHSGACKPGVDSGKMASTRSTCQSKWVRIGSSSTSTGDDHNCFSDLELKTFGNNADSINQRKIDYLQDVKVVTESVIPLFDRSLSTLCDMKALPEAHIPDNSIKRFGASGSFSSKQLKLLEEHTDSSGSHLEYDSKGNVLLRTFEYEVGLRCLGSESKLVDPSNFNLQFEGSEVGKKEPPTGSTDGLSESFYSYPCKSSAGGCDKSFWHLPTPEISKTGHSPRLLAAAEILCEMGRCSNGIRRQNDTIGKIIRPKAPSQKTMKARKSMSSVEKTERLFLGARDHDPIKHKLTFEKKTDFIHMNNGGTEAVRWSFSPEGANASPGKPEREIHVAVNHRPPLHGNSAKPFGLILSPTRVEKGYDNNKQKLRRVTLKTSPVAFGETYIKDWSRGRSKRV